MAKLLLLTVLLWTSLVLIFSVAVDRRKLWIEKSECPINGQCTCIIRTRLSHCCCQGLDGYGWGGGGGGGGIPQNLSSNLRILKLIDMGNGMRKIDVDDLKRYPLLEEFEISNASELSLVNADAFRHLTRLRKLSITKCARLTQISGTLLEKNRRIQSLILNRNALLTVPQMRMSDEHSLTMETIDLSWNSISILDRGIIERIHAKSLRLDNNRLTMVHSGAFAHCKFVSLYLNNNPSLVEMSPDTFVDISELHNLNLSMTGITELPVNGIKHLRSLILRRTESLKRLPPILTFTSLQEAQFTYPYHCCLFKHADREIAHDRQGLYRDNLNEIRRRHCSRTIAHTTTTPRPSLEERKRGSRSPRRLTPYKHNHSLDGEPFDMLHLMLDQWGQLEESSLEIDDEEYQAPIPRELVGRQTRLDCVETVAQAYYRNITCSPQPDALNPCEDVVGFAFLRVAIWVVWICAIVGNVAVWLILALINQPRMKVHYFFMANLALADFLTGIYLAMLAIEDLRTSNEYYNHAVEWQTGWGCKVAGFVSVFASELSIITMFLIALEMWYNTKFAFYGRRFHPKLAYTIMAIGYLFSGIAAAVPLLGSTYSKTSVCLPIGIESFYEKVYIISGLCFNLIAFLGMVWCYAMIYAMMADTSTPSRAEDRQVVKKMAILIGTDMLCWSPTLFFGLTAAANMPLISISIAKIFLVLFYPINAFANPFLYVFFTKVVRKNVKNRALKHSMLRRLSTNYARSFNSIRDYFYNSPGCAGGGDEYPCSSSQKFLGVTQMTSLNSMNSTPRESNSSSHQKTISSLDLVCAEQHLLQDQDQISPRVSFTEVRVVERVAKSRWRWTIWNKVKVSSPPNMSDISEHSSSEHNTDILLQHKLSKASNRSSFIPVIVQQEINEKNHHDLLLHCDLPLSSACSPPGSLHCSIPATRLPLPMSNPTVSSSLTEHSSPSSTMTSNNFHPPRFVISDYSDAP